MGKFSVGTFWIAALLPLPVLAQSPSDERMCRNGLFPGEAATFSLAKVTGDAKLHFLNDGQGCPEKDATTCQQSAYVLPGDTVLVSKRMSGFRCAFYPNKVGGSAGWVPENRIEAMTVDTQPKLQQWAGTWVDGDDSIRMDLRGAKLHASGEAFWPSKNPSAEQRPYGPNLGDFEATASPDHNVVTFVEGEAQSANNVCRVKAVLVNDLLVVSDNQMCGGMNVRFNGVYRRQQ